MEKENVYIHCAGLLGGAVARILKDGEYNVKGFIDNNKYLQDGYLLGWEIKSPDILKDVPNALVIICHTNKDTCNEIRIQLKELGLKENQIRIINNLTDIESMELLNFRNGLNELFAKI